MLSPVRISSYECTWEVWREIKKLEFLSATPLATLMLLPCSPNFPLASITRYMYAKHEPILKYVLSKTIDVRMYTGGNTFYLCFTEYTSELKFIPCKVNFHTCHLVN